MIALPWQWSMLLKWAGNEGREVCTAVQCDACDNVEQFNIIIRTVMAVPYVWYHTSYTVRTVLKCYNGFIIMYVYVRHKHKTENTEYCREREHVEYIFFPLFFRHAIAHGRYRMKRDAALPEILSTNFLLLLLIVTVTPLRNLWTSALRGGAPEPFVFSASMLQMRPRSPCEGTLHAG